MKGAAITVILTAAAWLAWREAANLAAWAGFEDIDILWQVAGVFAVLALGEAVVSRLPASISGLHDEHRRE